MRRSAIKAAYRNPSEVGTKDLKLFSDGLLQSPKPLPLIPAIQPPPVANAKDKWRPGQVEIFACVCFSYRPERQESVYQFPLHHPSGVEGGAVTGWLTWE